MRVFSHSLRRSLLAAASCLAVAVAPVAGSLATATPASAASPPPRHHSAVHTQPRAAVTPLTWTKTQIDTQMPTPSEAPLNAISCPSSSYCAAGDFGGDILWTSTPTGKASSWNASNVDTTPINAIACTTPAFCVAGDSLGNLLIGNNTGGAQVNGRTVFAITTSPTLPAAKFMEGYSEGLSAQGGPTPFTWSLAVGSTLPSGLTLNSDGVVSGVVTAAPGTYFFTIVATDSASNKDTATKRFSLTVQQSISIASTSPLPNATQGSYYLAGLAAVDGASGATFTWAVTAGTIPAGLTFGCPQNGANTCGTLWGTPTTTGTSTFTVTVTDSSLPPQSASVQFSITVDATVRAFQVSTTSPLPPAVAGQLYSIELSAIAGNATAAPSPPYTWAISAGTLPGGLSMGACGATTQATCGVISGIPTNPGTSSFTVKATDAVAVSVTAVVSLTIAQSLVVTSITVPDGIVGSGYQAGLSTVGGTSGPDSWVPVAGSPLPTWATLTSDGTIFGQPNAAANTAFSVTVSNGTQTLTSAFTIRIVTLSNWPISPVDSGVAINSVSCPPQPSSSQFSTVCVASDNTGDVLVWTISTLLGVSSFVELNIDGATPVTSVACVPQTLDCLASDSAGFLLSTQTPNVAWTMSATTIDAGIAIKSLNCPSTALCVAGDVKGNILSSTNAFAVSPPSPAAWISVAEDGGNAINSLACPSVTLCFAADSRGSILYGTSSFVVANVTLPATMVGNSYQFNLTADNGNPFTGTGTTVTCPSGASMSLIAGQQAYCWSVVSGALPPGLILNTDGTISGVPTTSGTYLVNVQAQDNSTPAQTTPTRQLSLTISPSATRALTITSSTLPSATLGESYTTDLVAIGGTGPYSWTITSGSLPPGLCLFGQLNCSSATIPGQITDCPNRNPPCSATTPSATGTYTFTVEVTDSSSPVQTYTVAMTISVSSVLAWSMAVAADGATASAINSLSCVNSTLCVFVDAGLANHVGGKVVYSTNPTGPASAWSAAANSLNSISCPSSSLCAAVDTIGNLVTSTNASATTPTWAMNPFTPSVPPDQGHNVASISCDPTASECSSVDGNHDLLNFTPGNPPPWKNPVKSAPIAVGNDPLTGISCPISTLCVLVDSIGHVITATWSTPGLNLTTSAPVSRDGIHPMTGISCPSINLCVATDSAGNIISSTNPAQGAQATWTSAVGVDGNRAIDAISCASTTLCVAVDASGNVMTATNPSGGSSAWKLTRNVDTTWLNAVSCPVDKFCVASDGAGNILTSGDPTAGASAWTTQQVDGGQAINAISCASDSFCAAADAAGNVVLGTSSSLAIGLPTCDNGVFPGAATMAAQFGTANCGPPTNTPTTSVSASGGTTPYTWTISAGSLPPGICLYPTGTPLPGPACPTSVSGSSAQVEGIPTSIGVYNFTVEVTDSSAQPQAATASYSITVSPKASSFCWNLEAPADPSCPTPPAAAGADGVNAIDSVACASVISCLATDDAGNILGTTNPTAGAGAWKEPAPQAVDIAPTPANPPPPPPPMNVLAVVCPVPTLSTTLCVSGDSAGNILTTLDPNDANPCWEAANGAGCQALNVAFAGTPVDSGNSIVAISCPTVDLCVAVDNKGNAITSTNPASPPPTPPTWTRANAEGGGSSPVNSVSCPSVSLCVAVDDAGDVITSTNPTGGAGAWNLSHVDSFTKAGGEAFKGYTGTCSTPPAACPTTITVHGFTSVSCPTVVFCVATDATGHVATSFHPTTGAAGWTITDIQGTSNTDVEGTALNAIACPASSFCMAFDAGGMALDSFNPAGGAPAWSNSACPSSNLGCGALSDPGRIVNALACPTTNLCLATDQVGNILVAQPNILLSILTTSLPSVNQGGSYAQSLIAIGGSSPYSWSVASGALPTGLTLSTAGTLTGSPTSSGTFTFVVKVLDSSTPQQAAIAQLSITVSVSLVKVTTSSLPPAALNTTYSAVIKASGGTSPYTWSVTGGLLPPGLRLASSGSIFGAPTISGSFSFTVQATDSSTPSQVASAALAIVVSSTPRPTSTQGYWLAGADGSVFPFGNLAVYPPPTPIVLSSGDVVVGMAAHPDQHGYWLATAQGGAYAFGDSLFFGSMAGFPLNKPVVGIAATADGSGYWMVASDGGIFSFGDASFYGSTGAIRLNQPIVGMSATPDGHGYWLVAADGGIFAYGDAAFYGSTGSINLSKPMVGMSPTLDGRGYWLVAGDGGVFPYGDAGFYGSAAGLRLVAPVVAIVPTPDNLGYWLVSQDGGVFAYGDATYFGSRGVGATYMVGAAS